MTKKVLALITGIVGGIQTAAVAAVTYFSPEYAAQINSAIVVAGAAIIEICQMFTNPESKTEEK